MSKHTFISPSPATGGGKKGSRARQSTVVTGLVRSLAHSGICYNNSLRPGRSNEAGSRVPADRGEYC